MEGAMGFPTGLSIFDPDYVRKNLVVSLRKQAADQNGLRYQSYVQASKDWVAANLHGRDLGLPIADLPIRPKKAVVDDAGEWHEVEWTDLLPPVLPAASGVPSSGAIAAKVGLPADRLDQVLAQNALIYGILQDIFAAVKK
jgi:hypothetical protein